MQPLPTKSIVWQYSRTPTPDPPVLDPVSLILRQLDIATIVIKHRGLQEPSVQRVLADATTLRIELIRKAKATYRTNPHDHKLVTAECKHLQRAIERAQYTRQFISQGTLQGVQQGDPLPPSAWYYKNRRKDDEDHLQHQ